MSILYPFALAYTYDGLAQTCGRRSLQARPRRRPPSVSRRITPRSRPPPLLVLLATRTRRRRRQHSSPRAPPSASSSTTQFTTRDPPRSTSARSRVVRPRRHGTARARTGSRCTLTPNPKYPNDSSYQCRLRSGVRPSTRSSSPTSTRRNSPRLSRGASRTATTCSASSRLASTSRALRSGTSPARKSPLLAAARRTRARCPFPATSQRVTRECLVRVKRRWVKLTRAVASGLTVNIYNPVPTSYTVPGPRPFTG